MASPKVGISGDIGGVDISGFFRESIERRAASRRLPAGDKPTIGLLPEWLADDALLQGRRRGCQPCSGALHGSSARRRRATRTVGVGHVHALLNEPPREIIARTRGERQHSPPRVFTSRVSNIA
jgi:hypothetical protein